MFFKIPLFNIFLHLLCFGIQRKDNRCNFTMEIKLNISLNAFVHNEYSGVTKDL